MTIEQVLLNQQTIINKLDGLHTTLLSKKLPGKPDWIKRGLFIAIVLQGVMKGILTPETAKSILNSIALGGTG